MGRVAGSDFTALEHQQYQQQYGQQGPGIDVLFERVNGIFLLVTRTMRIMEKVIPEAKFKTAIEAIDAEDKAQAERVEVADPRVDQLVRQVENLQRDVPNIIRQAIAQAITATQEHSVLPMPPAADNDLDMGGGDE